MSGMRPQRGGNCLARVRRRAPKPANLITSPSYIVTLPGEFPAIDFSQPLSFYPYVAALLIRTNPGD